jgi:hypothetical protein
VELLQLAMNMGLWLQLIVNIAAHHIGTRIFNKKYEILTDADHVAQRWRLSKYSNTVQQLQQNYKGNFS